MTAFRGRKVDIDPVDVDRRCRAHLGAGIVEIIFREGLVHRSGRSYIGPRLLVFSGLEQPVGVAAENDHLGVMQEALSCWSAPPPGTPRSRRVRVIGKMLLVTHGEQPAQPDVA
jgi:hypothetical protein